MEITEKTQFPGFRFLRWVEFGGWQRQRRLPKKKLRFGGSRLGVCDMLSPIWEQDGNPGYAARSGETKMEIPVQHPGWLAGFEAHFL
jgi:hypothetical protein